MILDGKAIKNNILSELQFEVSKLDVKPKLVVIQVGDNEASNVYIKQKKNMCEYIGYMFEHIRLSDAVDTEELLELISRLNDDKNVNGILVQLPLPVGVDSNMIVNAISPLKDVDGLTDLNNGMLFHNKDALYSCTPYGVMELLDRYNIDVSGKNVVIVGRSALVGKPMAMMMLNRDATVTVCHSKTKDLESYTKRADILIVAIGKPGFITGDMVSNDTVVIDVGISRTQNGIYGDVDFATVGNKVKYITPVPGGVGPMTVAMLAMNILKAFNIQNR